MKGGYSFRRFNCKRHYLECYVKSKYSVS